jgi:hypothetical protein
MRESLPKFAWGIGFMSVSSHFRLNPQTVLLVRFVDSIFLSHFCAHCHAHTAENATFKVSGAPSDSLWRPGAPSGFLQQAPLAIYSGALALDAATEHSILAGRPHSRIDLLRKDRFMQDQQNRNLAVQRNLSFTVRTFQIPRPMFAADGRKEGKIHVSGLDSAPGRT